MVDTQELTFITNRFVVPLHRKHDWLLVSKSQFTRDTKLSNVPDDYHVDVFLAKETHGERYFICVHVFDENKNFVWSHHYEIPENEVIYLDEEVKRIEERKRKHGN
jgi:hypothetical protein